MDSTRHYIEQQRLVLLSTRRYPGLYACFHYKGLTEILSQLIRAYLSNKLQLQ